MKFSVGKLHDLNKNEIHKSTSLFSLTLKAYSLSTPTLILLEIKRYCAAFWMNTESSKIMHKSQSPSYADITQVYKSNGLI
jgi:hypothetical protein